MTEYKGREEMICSNGEIEIMKKAHAAKTRKGEVRERENVV